MSLIHPVIMSGGSGTRLWPVSRALYPKQFLQLTSERSMLQESVLRVTDAARFAAPIIICSEEHRFIIAEQLRALNIAPQAILLEPVARSTAAVAALASLYVQEHDQQNKNPLFLLMPTDHVIGDVPAFLAACDQAAKAAEQGFLTTFGIRPDQPETGYGYIKPGEAVGAGPVARVAQFIEKPDAATAATYVQQGYLWNSGMFMLSAKTVLEELGKLQPDILTHVREALAKAARDLDFIRLDKAAFAAVPAISIDYGLMEKTAHAAVLPASIQWSDIGSWQSMWEQAAKDKQGNATKGDVLLQQSENCYVHSENGLTVALGMKDAVIISLDDVVMVANRNNAQDVKQVVDALKAKKRSEVQHGRRVYRPWGWYESLGEGNRFQVKRLMVNPGCKLSLQLHHHRSEHWVVVCGMGEVTRDDEQLLLYENQSIYLPAGTKHRLANPGKLPLLVVEVQSGAYLGEDDIVRLEDTYGRA